MWFRIGEAIVFTFVLFLWLLLSDTQLLNLTWLPLVGLFVGMFIKSGEMVIYGIAKRVLTSATSLVGFDECIPRGRSPTGLIL